MARWSGNPADSEHVDRSPAELAADPQLDPLLHHGWAEYRSGAATHGAPMRLYRLPVTATPDPTDSVDVPGPDVMGDQMLWCVYNDADPARHTNGAGLTLPLGVEVQQTLFAFARPGAPGDVVFLRFRIVNKGGNTIDDFHASLWSDPDVGGFTDDLVGCDVGRSLGFAYNAISPDAVYGTAPPAVGYALLRGPTAQPGGTPLGMTAFSKYIGGTDPGSFDETFNYMHGLLPDGSVLVDPITNQPTTYFHPGDPVTGLGWLDANPADRRFLQSSGPGHLAPGETQDLWAAIVVGRGADRLASVGTVRCLVDFARTAFEQGFPLPLPSESVSCSTTAGPAIVSCPRPASYWGLECAAGGADELTLAQLGEVASFVDARSTLFAWSGGPLTAFCSALNPGPSPDLRQRARREFAAFLANYAGSLIPLPVAGGDRIHLHPDAPVSCPPLTATTIEQLAATADLGPKLLSATYLNNVLDHRRAIEGVNFGLTGFDGGADAAINFLGASSIDPAIQPDSFTTVELRFSHTATQKAYRFLRLEKASTGGAPPQGRSYLYGGYRDINLEAWDTVHNRQLELAFVENTLTADDGTILPAAQQPATLDSTWAPDASILGGREYLWVLDREYTGAPVLPQIGHDGAPIDNSIPLMWALIAKLRAADDVIDDGDAFQFEWGRPPSPGADLLLYDLEQGSLADPAVQQGYTSVIDCLSAINAGVGIGATCVSIPTPTLISLVHAIAATDHVTLRWYSDADLSATVERRARGEGWRPVGRVVTDGVHQLRFDDTDVVPGTRYDYRLAVQTPRGTGYFGEASVEVPTADRLAVLGMQSGPGDGGLAVRFSLASRAPARLEIMDVAGRRILARDLAGLEPGSHILTLEGGASLPSGIYLLRLRQGGQQARGKAAIIR
jgi:hypothetical protein